MPSKSNIVAHSFEQGAGLDREIHELAYQLGVCLTNRVESLIDELVTAEKAALTRLAEYVPQDRLLNVKEAAAYLKFSPRWLDEGTRPGKSPVVPFILIGGEKRFRLSSLDQHLTRLEVRGKKVSL